MMVYGGKSKSTRRAYRTSVGDVLAAHGTHLSLSFALGDQFANSRNELRGNPHKCLGFVFQDRKSTRLNSSHGYISYAVFCLKKKKQFPDPPDMAKFSTLS